MEATSTLLGSESRVWRSCDTTSLVSLVVLGILSGLAWLLNDVQTSPHGGEMNHTLWRWYPAKDEWEYVTEATPEMKRKVLARYKRHDAKGARYKWTDGAKPRRFRARASA